MVLMDLTLKELIRPQTSFNLQIHIELSKSGVIIRFNFYEASSSNPNFILPRELQPHYRDVQVVSDVKYISVPDYKQM